VLVFGWLRLPHVRGERIPYPRRARRRPRHRRRRPVDARARQGRCLGLGLDTDHRRACRVRRRHRLVRPSLPAPPAARCSTATLFRRRSFTGASIVATLYSIAFGAFLLSLVLWDQNVWHWSALANRARDRAGPVHRAADHAAARRTHDHPLRRGCRDRDRREPLHRRCRLVRPVRRVETRLLRRHLPRPRDRRLSASA